MDSQRSRNVPRSSSNDPLTWKEEDLINSSRGRALDRPVEDAVTSQRPGEVTGLLMKWQDGDRAALEQLIPLVHAELRMLARRSLRGESAGDALQTAELINEAYLKLVNCSRVQWHDRTHFFAIAATLMRRVLVDEARKRQFQKRGGEFTRITFDDAMTVAPERSSELIALDEALDRLAEHSGRKSRVVELRYFAGLSIEETAAAMGVSIDVVKREWRTARLWLMKELTAPEAGRNGSCTVGED
jgi:RNA polymerase sigma factor (TIGR02999 family)